MMMMFRAALLLLVGLAMRSHGAEGLIVSAAGQGAGGLPYPVVTAVVQTKAGDLWCGTYYGLARFDGVRFTVYDGREAPRLPDKGVTALFADEAGNLWVGMKNGALAEIRDRDPVVVIKAGDGGAGDLLGIGQDAAGDVWAVWFDRTLMRIRDGFRLKCPDGTMACPGGLNLVGDSEKRLWLVHRSGLLEVSERGLKEAAAGTEGGIPDVGCATASRLGGLWVVSRGRLRRWCAGKWAEDPDGRGWDAAIASRSSVFVMAMKELHDGRLLVGTFNGGAAVGRPGEDFQVYGMEAGLPSSWVRCVCEDHEGNLWLGTGGGGLAALRQRRVTMVAVEQGPTRHNIQCLLPTREGGLWVGTEGAGVWRLDGVSPERVADGFHRENITSSVFIWSLGEDARGSVWMGDWDGGLNVKEPGADGFRPAAGWPGKHREIKLVFAAKDGVVWVGGAGELLRFKDGAWRSRDENGALFTPPGLQSIAEDSEGGIWVGTDDGRVARRFGKDLAVYGPEQGMPGDSVIAILPQANGSVWLGTMGGGLIRLKYGRAVAITTRQGLPSTMVSQLQTDGRGYLWAGTAGGICRMSLEKLEACADGKAQGTEVLVLSSPDGMATIGCSSGGNPGCCATADGRLWFATNKGLAVVDPAAIPVNTLPPPVVIQSLSRDGTPVDLRRGPVKLGPGTVSCAITYTGLSFTAPERVRFRTRLEGLEKTWQDAGLERTAVYRYLRPGDYVFHVIAANNDGVWNMAGASIPFTIRGHLWQMLWFQTLLGIAVVLIVALVVGEVGRRRSAVRLAAAEKRYALERERTRIARDIHDDLGSGLTRIMLLSKAAREELPQGSPAERDLKLVASAAEQLTRTMDEIVWAVDPRRDSLDSLVAYVGSAAQEFLSAAGIRFRLEAPNEPPDWRLSAECRHSLFLAFKEALHNVVRHSGARMVKVSFAVAARSFTLSVEDDGHGFSAADAGSRIHGGRGLEHLQRRLAEIGGTCEVESRSGEGTTVSFRVPVDGEALSTDDRTQA